MGVGHIVCAVGAHPTSSHVGPVQSGHYRVRECTAAVPATHTAAPCRRRRVTLCSSCPVATIVRAVSTRLVVGQGAAAVGTRPLLPHRTAWGLIASAWTSRMACRKLWR